MKLQTKVIVTQLIHDAGMKLMRANIEQVIVSTNDKINTIAEYLDETVTGVVVRYNPFPKELFDRAPNLKVIVRHGIGVELIDVAYATKKGVLVVNTPDAATLSVAEHAVCLMMVLGRNILAADCESRKANFAFKDSYVSKDLDKHTLCLVGAGKIGLEVARICKNGFNMNINAYDPYADSNMLKQYGITPCSSLDELLPVADYLSLHAPLSSVTRHMITMRELKQMKSTAFLINCGRGSLVKEEHLVKALQDKIIAGAGLDVLEEEPPVQNNPLFSLDNVVITPHSSSLTVQSKIKMAVNTAEQLIQALQGMVPDNVINKEAIKSGRC